MSRRCTNKVKRTSPIESKSAREASSQMAEQFGWGIKLCLSNSGRCRKLPSIHHLALINLLALSACLLVVDGQDTAIHPSPKWPASVYEFEHWMARSMPPLRLVSEQKPELEETNDPSNSSSSLYPGEIDLELPNSPVANSSARQFAHLQTRDVPPGSLMVAGIPERKETEFYVAPYDNFVVNSSRDLSNSYVIDNKRYVEAVSSRCLASTVLQDPETVEPDFIIITPSMETRIPATASLEQIRMTGFDPAKRTTILVHGFTQSYPNTTWLRKSRALFEMNHLLNRYNLIIMDWGKASSGTYSQVAAAVSVMASYLANFLGKLIDSGSDQMGIHIVGHSLGSHLAGFAGKRLRPRIGRITALDPAGPCFGKFFSNSASDRLSADDAFEVDAFHYDDAFLGLPGQHGQFDVYVNGGSSQPGCSDNVNTMFNAVLTMLFKRNRVLSESHTRSTEVATAQLAQTGCQEVAYECRDYNSFVLGECGKCDNHNSQCFFMGLNYQYADIDTPLRTSFPGKRLYISTAPHELFCVNHYQILVRFEPTPELAQLAKRGKWRIHLELYSDQKGRFNVTVTNLMSANTFSYLLLTEAPPMRIKAARMQIRTSDGVFSLSPVMKQNSKNQIRVFAIEVNFMSNIDPLIRRSISSRLCPAAWLPSSAPSQNGDANLILDASQAPTDNGWLHFDECFLN